MKITRKNLYKLIRKTIKEVLEERRSLIPSSAEMGGLEYEVPVSTVYEAVLVIWCAAIDSGYNPEHQRSPFRGETIADLIGLMKRPNQKDRIIAMVQEAEKLLPEEAINNVLRLPKDDLWAYAGMKEKEKEEWSKFPPLESPYRTIKAADFD